MKAGFWHARDKKKPFSSGCTSCHGADLTGDTGPSCYKCHDEEWDETSGSAGGFTSAISIRTCEGCHGPDSLHNIQAGAAPVVGGEPAGFGHVGHDDDCWGCHGFATASLPSAIPVVATIYGTDVGVINAGTDTVVTLTGLGFVNTSGGKVFKSRVALTADDGSSVTLTPGALAGGGLVVTIPGDTAAGNYKLQAVKTDMLGDPVASNPVSITIKPQVVITGITADAATLTITGSGFCGYAAGSGTSVVGNGADLATVVSWSDTEIVVEFNSTPEEITVNSVFGRATAKVSGDEPSTWVVSPLLRSQFLVTFEPYEGFLVVRTSYSSSKPGSISLGMEFDNVIFWMDTTGAIFFGNIDHDAGTASGIAFGYNAGSSIWSAEQIE